MEENKVLYCQSCGAPLKIVMNKPFVFCQFCGAKNIIDSQQMKAKIKFQNIDISANTETDSIIDSAEFAIQTKDFAKAKELIMAAIISGRNDYKIYVCKAHMDLLTDDNGGLFDDLEKLRKIEQKEKDQGVTDAICELMKYKGTNGIMALHNATFHERMDMVEFCVEHGADVNARAGMNNVSPISIMYVPVSKNTSKLDGTPFIRNKQTVKKIRDYLVAHGAYDDYKSKQIKKTSLIVLAVIGILVVVIAIIAAIVATSQNAMRDLLSLIPFLIGRLIFPVVCSIVARNKGRSTVGWFFCGLFGVVSLIVLLILPKKN